MADAKGGKGAQLFQCDYCSRDLTNVVRIRCAECKDFDLCLDCFSVGAEVNGHKKTHDYHVMEKLDFPLLSEDWTAHQEALLLQGLEQYGLGNWSEVAMHVGSQSKGKCEDHYYTHYVDCPTGPMPDLNRVTAERTLRPMSAAAEEQMKKLADLRAQHTMQGPPPKQNKKGDYYTNANAPPGSDVVGYMPSRGDFDVEYDNDAEAVLADMTIDPNEGELERKLKIALLEAYNWRLGERRRRKEWVIQCNLLDMKKVQAQEKRRSKEEKELHQRMRIFQKALNSQEEYDDLVSGIAQESRIRQRISELHDLRRAGKRTLAEAETDDSAKPKKKRSEKRGHIESMPGAELLSGPELKLAKQVRLNPAQLLQVKDIMIRESLRLGQLPKDHACKLVRIDAAQSGAIFDFIVSSGWVNGKWDPDRMS